MNTRAAHRLLFLYAFYYMNHDPRIVAFYVSPAWRTTRAAYIQSKGGLCERCWARGLVVPGTQVHHRLRLTGSTVSDPHVALAFSNLELLCSDCHHDEHRKTPALRTDPFGRVDLGGPRGVGGGPGGRP